MNRIQITRKLAVVAVATAVLAGCSSLNDINDDGTAASELKWPTWDRVTFNKNRGTFPDFGSLNQVKPGLTKDELYYLIGRPHYDELWRPREWNYLFHFHTPGQGTDNVTACQFKVLFDRNMRVGSTHWQPVDPVDAACAPAEEKPAQQPQRYTLGADALFAFDRSSEGDLNPRGRAELDELATKLQSFAELNSVTVVGHTDRLGSDAYNQSLSQARAETVRQYLIGRGIPASKIRAWGAGETQPVKQCQNTGNRADLIACLQPNRRVEVHVDGYGVRK